MAIWNQKFTDEDLKECLRNGMSSSAIAAKYSISIRQVQRRKALLAAAGFSPEHDLTHEVPEGYKLKGTSTLYKDGKVAIQWVKTCQDTEAQFQLMREAVVALIEDLPKVSPKTIYNEHSISEDVIAVYPLGDPHVGMLSWEQETGDNWDLAIAEQVFISIFDRVVKAAPRCRRAVIINLGDLFHRDNAAGTTSRSENILDCDGRYAKMVQVTMKIIRRMIESALEHHDIVEVKNLPGNHDDVSSLFLSVALKHIYENEPRVIIDDSPSVFQYVRFGKNLIGAHHGHTCKMDKLPGVMAADRAKEWGETEFRYWLTGHIHHDSKKEFPGCMVESFRTLAAKDNYATAGGWRSGRDTKVIVYHKDFGEVERHTINIAQL